MKITHKKKSIFTGADIHVLINHMKVVFPTSEEVGQIVEEKLNKKIKFLPSKEEFFKRMDTLSGEVKAMRESQELHSEDHSRINDRLDTVEKRLKISSQ